MRAFDRYEQRLNALYQAKQDAAMRFLDSFALLSKLALFLQTAGSRVLAVPWLADRLVRRWPDPVRLPTYASLGDTQTPRSVSSSFA
jgi:hypothetical protein